MAAILALILLVLGSVSTIAVIFILDEGIYTTSEKEVQDRYFNAYCMQIALEAFEDLHDDVEQPDYWTKDSNVCGISIRSTDARNTQWGRTDSGRKYTVYVSYKMQSTGSEIQYFGTEKPAAPEASEELATVDVYIREELSEHDIFYRNHRLIQFFYIIRPWVFWTACFGLIGALLCTIFLIRSAGYRADQEAPHAWLTTRIPADLWYAGTGFAAYLLLQFFVEGIRFRGVMGAHLLLILPLCGLFLLLSMDFAVRCRVGGVWKNTVLCRIFTGFRRCSKKLWQILKELFVSLPLIWKTAVICLSLSALHLIVVLFNYGEPDNLLIWWAVENILLLPVILSSALMLRKLLKAGKQLADGNPEYKVDTSRMVLDFKTHGENLNHIGDGINAAVQKQLRSERMKTELITNVSHDIKTPLTSIINYSDLIGREECDNPQITAYAEVLHRQSERLKRLIEDLVEASKASTGNLEINLTPCEVGVMLQQAAGEYEEKLTQNQLQLIVKKPEAPVMILADGRRLWRIFDNLLVNISKYAQPGTRVFLTLEEQGSAAVISFKNTSRAVLDITPEELMERFVRGDSARSSEGNGLGLSIAKSLTELQGGTMEVCIDGDFFKVVLTFPKQ